MTRACFRNAQSVAIASAGRPHAPDGFTLLELLLGLTLGLGALAALTALLSASLAARTRAGQGCETLAATAAAIEEIARDVRLAGYDPQARGIGGIVAADAASLVLETDLDGDGAINASSEEHVAYRGSAGTASLLRVVGAQSMPLLSDVSPTGLTFRYRDASGATVDPTLPGALAAIRAVTIEIATLPNRTLPGVRLSGGARVLNR
jgi:Tfp pilus assembly protein PilW